MEQLMMIAHLADEVGMVVAGIGFVMASGDLVKMFLRRKSGATK